MSHSYIRVFYHLTWATKKRLPLITKAIKPRLYKSINATIKKEDLDLLAIGGIYDHVHVLIRTDREISVAQLIRKIKSRSAKIINETGEVYDYIKWQEGYGNCSVSSCLTPKAIRYINNQEKHHKLMDYEEELKLLKLI